MLIFYDIFTFPKIVKNETESRFTSPEKKIGASFKLKPIIRKKSYEILHPNFHYIYWDIYFFNFCPINYWNTTVYRALSDTFDHLKISPTMHSSVKTEYTLINY